MTTKITKTIVATLVVACSLILTSCGKDGAPGATGPAGVDGNANVMSYKFSVDASNFVGPLAPGYIYQFPLDPTTLMGSGNYVGANDAVLMYFYDQTLSGTDYYNAMPYNDYWDNSSDYNQYSFEIGATGPNNKILINIRNSNAAQPYANMTPGATTLSFKMVYIQATNLRTKPTLPKDLSYKSIKAYYNLKD